MKWLSIFLLLGISGFAVSKSIKLDSLRSTFGQQMEDEILRKFNMENLTILERCVMTVVVGLTNLCCWPALYVVYKQNLLLTFWNGIFTFVCSFMYHMMEPLNIEKIYLTGSQWHKLDNIGSIMWFVLLAIYMMDNAPRQPIESPPMCNTDIHLFFIGLFLALIMQTEHPWKLENTLVPVVLFLILLLLSVTLRGPGKYRSSQLKRGGIFLLIAFYCFGKGLDDDNDYLRIFHGCWHMFGSIAIFYIN